jgi:hypothetical protein
LSIPTGASINQNFKKRNGRTAKFGFINMPQIPRKIVVLVYLVYVVSF